MPAALAAALLPTAIKLGANLLGNNSSSPYERQLSKYAQSFQQQADQPITENKSYTEGKRIVDRRDKEQRKAIQSSSAATGATNESQLAATEDQNEVYADALNRLIARAQNYRTNMQGRYLNLLGQQENARQNRNARFQKKVNNIASGAGKAASTYLLSDLFAESGGGEDNIFTKDRMSYAPESSTNNTVVSGHTQDFNLFG